MFVVGRVASGCFHVGENERGKCRLTRVDERSNAERYHHDLVLGCWELAWARAEGEPRCVREFGVFPRYRRRKAGTLVEETRGKYADSE